MNQSTEWKEHYAPTIYGNDINYHPRLRLGVMHHINPMVDGAAHCAPSVRLDMPKATSEHPGEALCQRCRRLRPFYAEAVDEQYVKGADNG